MEVRSAHFLCFVILGELFQVPRIAQFIVCVKHGMWGVVGVGTRNFYFYKRGQLVMSLFLTIQGIPLQAKIDKQIFFPEFIGFDFSSIEYVEIDKHILRRLSAALLEASHIEVPLNLTQGI